MDNLVRYLKFPFQFDPERLQKDLQKITDHQWKPHYNTNDYDGDWSSIALVSQGGKSDNINAFPIGTEKATYTEIMDPCLYLKEVIDRFSFEKTTVRLLRLATGASIKPHTDNCLGYEDGYFRIHIPIITNEHVEFILDGQRLQMNEGECWYIDANFTHSVANNGAQDRIHLVIDGIRNEWTDELFFKQASEEQFIRSMPELKDNEKQLMIEELKKMNTPAANQIIAELLKK
ncbi:aspartyl/asparaginyl beta-hydroxylase domain-containing protein [Flavobacterium sp. U410]